MKNSALPAARWLSPVRRTARLLACLCLVPTLTLAVRAQAEAPFSFVDLTKDDLVTPSSGQVSVAPTSEGLVVTIQPGPEGYPGIKIKAPRPGWDLGKYGHIEALITNLSAAKAFLALRVDNDESGSKSNSESSTIPANGTGSVEVIFGFEYGKKEAKYTVDGRTVADVLIFNGGAVKGTEPLKFRIDKLQAGGAPGEKPPVNPASIRTTPVDNFLVGGTVTTAPSQFEATGAQGTVDGSGVKVNFTGKGSLAIKPAAGLWDLRQGSEVHVKLKNDGSAPVAASAQVVSKPGPTEKISDTIAPGESKELVIPFAAAKPFQGISSATDKKFLGGLPGTGTEFISDAVQNVKISAEGPGSLVIESVKLAAPPAVLPDWLGKRPPVEGDWKMTMEDNFDGPKIDETIWNIKGENYYDKVTGYSKDNVILGDGVVKLRYEKRTGFHNDNPAGKQFSYMTGFLDSYGKWTQRYGYFETRVKNPKAPGLWPAFWLMPDRGPKYKSGKQWERASTSDGAMEFDIMEPLTRWGPFRYNIAMHYDGYDVKTHKQIGSTTVYVEPDKDGFLTVGLLWTPGLAVYYCQGKEVLRWEDPRISSVTSNLLYTLPSGGWDNNAKDDKTLPDDLVIDYVRIWQRGDLAQPTDGKQAGGEENAQIKH